MITRHSRTLLSLIVIAGFLAACYLAFTVSAETPSATKTKKAVQAAEAAAKKAEDAGAAAGGTAVAATYGTSYPATDDGKAAADADKNADAADAAADDAEKAAEAAREKACRSGNADDAKAADAAEQAAKDAEAKADAADAAADKADRKADPFGKQLQKKKRDAGRALRSAMRAARAAICFALQCAQLMDESSEQNKKKKKETIETIEGLDSGVDHLALAPQPGGSEVKTAQGLHNATFDTPQGRVIVNLPDDMRAGDTISGTVMSEPKGQTPEERTRNLTELNGYVIELETPKKPDGTSNPLVKAQVTATLSPFTFTLPPSSPPTPPLKSVSSTNSGGLGISLTNTSGSFTVGGTTTVPIEMIQLSLQSVAPLTLPQLPSIGQQGRPIVIPGPFDGNSSNTQLNWTRPRSAVQDFEKNTESVSGGFGLIAECPRKAVFTAPSNVTGPIEIQLKEGNKETKGTYRNVGVNLTAPKTSLLKGESTELHVEVQGLQGITEPVPLHLTKGGVVTMQGGDIQTMSIKPAEVQTNGTYTTTRTITGVQTGVWNATATVVVFDFCLQDDNTGNQLQFNSSTGDYRFCNLLPTVVAGDSGRAGFSFVGTTTAGDSPPCQGIWHGYIADIINGGPAQIGAQGQIQIQINKCTQTGGASGYFYQPVSIPSNASPKKINFTITDRDTRNNTCACK